MGEINIFVTGASGFIGKHLIKHILSKIDLASRVYVLVMSEIDFSDPRIIYLRGNLCELQKFRNEILICDYVYHLAANATFGNNIDYDKTNFEPTINLVNILKDSTVLKNFIFTSTIGAIDRVAEDDCSHPLTVESKPSPVSLYGKSKLKAEEFIKKSGIPFTIIRPTWVYGADMRSNSHINKFVSLCYENNPVFKFNFPGSVSLISVEDLAKAMSNAIGNKNVINKIYFASTEILSVGNILRIIFEKVKKKNIRQINIPRFKFFVSRLHSKMPLTIANLFLDYLVAKDEVFIDDFQLIDTKEFATGVMDVINSNAYNSGYWIITGANSGIGFSLSKKLDKMGKNLILLDKNINNLSAFSHQTVRQFDLSETDKIFDLAYSLSNYKLFRLINNAGIGYKKNFKEMSEAEILYTFKVNMIAPVLLTKFLLNNIIKNEGVIVNIASSVAFNPLPGMALYASSKSFILNWSGALWYELKKECDILTFSPAGTNTNFQKTAGVKSDNNSGLLSSEYVADQIIKIVNQKKPFTLIGIKNRIVNLVCKFFLPQFNVTFWGEMFKKLR